jgi:hypothetical protein
MSRTSRLASPVLAVLVAKLAPVLGADLSTRLRPRAHLLAAEPVDIGRERARVRRCRRWLVESWLPYLLQGAGMDNAAHRLRMACAPWRHLLAVRRALTRELDDMPQELFDALYEQSGDAEPFGHALFNAAATGERGFIGGCWGGELRVLGAAATALALYRFGACPPEMLQDLRLSCLSLLDDVVCANDDDWKEVLR